MSAGKGDSSRPVNLKVYRENFDAIDWNGKRLFPRDAETSTRDARAPRSEEMTHLEFMRSMGFDCANETDAYELRGLLDM